MEQRGDRDGQSKGVLYEEMGNDLYVPLVQPFHENINMGDVTIEAGSLLQRLSTLTEKADPLLCRWFLRKATLRCCPLRLPLTDAEKTAPSPCSLIVDRI